MKRVPGAAPPVRGGWIRGFWPAAIGTGIAATAALAILVTVCAFAAVAVPRASVGYRTRALQQTFHAASSAQTTVLADATITGLGGSSLSAAELASASDELVAGLHQDGLPLAPAAADWSGLATGSYPFSVTGQPATTAMAPPQIELLYRSGLDSSARLTAGSLPASASTRATSATFQVAITAATAARLGLRVGSQLQADGQGFVVTGIIQPLRAASSFWTVDPVASAPRLTYPSTNSAPYWSCAAFVGEAELDAMQRYLNGQPVQGLWSFPLDLSRVDADHAAGLQRVLQAVSYLPAAASVNTNLGGIAGQSATIQISLSSGLATSLASFVATDDAVQRALSPLFISLGVIAAVVVLLGARLVTTHRRGEFTMMRARGASLRQVATVAMCGGTTAVLPAAAVAEAAAVAATPGPASLLSWWLAGVIILAALAGPPLLAVWWLRTGRDATRGGLAAGARHRFAAARRWIFDGALVCGAVGGLVVLRQQGLPAAAGPDLFTSAAPVLVAVPVALLVIRGYPLVLRWLARLAGRRRGVVMVVGLARGSAAAQAGVLPAFALVLAFAVIAFAAMARDAVTRAEVSASWQAAGADAVITGPAVGPGITLAAQRLITGVPGVQRFATLWVTTGTSGQGLQVPVVVVDPRQYAALTAGTPAPAFPATALAPPRGSGSPAGGPVPALLSPAAREILGPGSRLWVAGHQLRLRVAGTLAGVAGASAGSQFAVLPRWALGRLAPDPTGIAVVGSRLDSAALIRTARRAAPGAQITLRSRLLAALSGAPLPRGGFAAFAEGALAAAAFSLLTLLLTLVLSARSRELTLTRLTTMGLDPAQSRRITTVETLPAILAAAVGGTACALALVPLVGPAVNLAAFTGTPVIVPLTADPVAIVAAAGGLLLLAALTLTIETRLARGRGATQALRLGE
jgi:putative ABC transport system permease protein